MFGGGISQIGFGRTPTSIISPHLCHLALKILKEIDCQDLQVKHMKIVRREDSWEIIPEKDMERRCASLMIEALETAFCGRGFIVFQRPSADGTPPLDASPQDTPLSESGRRLEYPAL